MFVKNALIVHWQKACAIENILQALAQLSPKNWQNRITLMTSCGDSIGDRFKEIDSSIENFIRPVEQTR
jgi:hypothetical protein